MTLEFLLLTVATETKRRLEQRGITLRPGIQAAVEDALSESVAFLLRNHSRHLAGLLSLELAAEHDARGDSLLAEIPVGAPENQPDMPTETELAEREARASEDEERAAHRPSRKPA